jgi:hypothetical protein
MVEDEYVVETMKCLNEVPLITNVDVVKGIFALHRGKETISIA